MGTRTPSRRRWRRSVTTSITSSTCRSGSTLRSCSARSRSCFPEAARATATPVGQAGESAPSPTSVGLPDTKLDTGRWQERRGARSMTGNGCLRPARRRSRSRWLLTTRDPSADTDLFETGVLDSMAFVELLLNLERSFGLKVAVDELEIENFRSIRKIADFVMARDASSRPFPG